MGGVWPRPAGMGRPSCGTPPPASSCSHSPAILARVTDVAFSPDGTRLATASEDATAKIWDVAPGKELLAFTYNNGYGRLALSPDGTRVATAGPDRAASVWDATTGQELLTMTGQGLMESQGFRVGRRSSAPMAATWLQPELDGTAQIWDIATGQLLVTVSGNKDAIMGVAFSPDGKRLATASLDGTAKSLGRRDRSAIGYASGSLHFCHDDRCVLTRWQAAGDGQLRTKPPKCGMPRLARSCLPSLVTPIESGALPLARTGSSSRQPAGMDGEDLGRRHRSGTVHALRPPQRSPQRRLQSGWEAARDSQPGCDGENLGRRKRSAIAHAVRP